MRESKRRAMKDMAAEQLGAALAHINRWIDSDEINDEEFATVGWFLERLSEEMIEGMVFDYDSAQYCRIGQAWHDLKEELE